eukprot:Phypoly_transcript_08629.p1 GENE.Phypoly_transcript_08629~~Phypoly_transcript_08629.p1  ORF type:complete len:358 (+),score=51.76 Phypoly_transcript_08629:402-1475(+)
MMGLSKLSLLILFVGISLVSTQTPNATVAPTDDPCSATIDIGTLYTYPLHIGSVFIILVASFIGAVIPIISKYTTTKFHLSPFQICVGKCVGIGVVLACGLVHMLQPSNESLTSPCVPAAFNTVYPAYAFLYCLIAGLVMQFVDYVVLCYFQKLAASGNRPTEESKLNSSASQEVPNIHGGHMHGGFIYLESAMQKTISAYLLEFGVTVHSVFIGLTVGVADDTTLHALLVALFFHQFFEGVALGARIADATTLSRFNEVMLCIIFSVAAPFGISLGIGIVSSLNANGEAFLLIQGTFDGVCAGILVYIGYVLLLKDFPEDMEKHCKGHKHENVMRAAMFVALWAGAGLMAFIGKYL